MIEQPFFRLQFRVALQAGRRRTTEIARRPDSGEIAARHILVLAEDGRIIGRARLTDIVSATIRSEERVA